MNNQLQNLQNAIIEFRDKRNWQQYHQIKDLLLGLQIEISELSELFLWKNEVEVLHIDKIKIEEEVADIFIFLTYICKHFDIELASVVENKIIKNGENYPIDKSLNSNKKYNEL
jgi:NTP pyrophosphatase (non-canonical NTP hydrolase)